MLKKLEKQSEHNTMKYTAYIFLTLVMNNAYASAPAELSPNSKLWRLKKLQRQKQMTDATIINLERELARRPTLPAKEYLKEISPEQRQKMRDGFVVWQSLQSDKEQKGYCIATECFALTNENPSCACLTCEFPSKADAISEAAWQHEVDADKLKAAADQLQKEEKCKRAEAQNLLNKAQQTRSALQKPYIPENPQDLGLDQSNRIASYLKKWQKVCSGKTSNLPPQYCIRKEVMALNQAYQHCGCKSCGQYLQEEPKSKESQ